MNFKVSREVPEKTLGILGGLGPAASAEFLRLLAVMAPADSDQKHPEIIMLSRPSIPDRSTFIMGNGPSPEGKLKEGLLQVASWGADILAVPCNTAHYFINRFREDLPVPLVHIVESTVDLAREKGPEGSWLLATEGTVKSGVYEEYANKLGYSLFLPSKELQNRVQESIRLVKANRTEEGGKLLKEAILDLWKEREIPVIAACTEIPLAYGKTDLPEAMCVSSLAALAEACLEKLYS